LLATINDMIAVSMIDAQTLMLSYQIAALPHIIQMVLTDLKSVLNERDLKVVFKPPPSGLQPFYADPHRLYQVFDYIITNSIKYTPDGGRITIELRVIRDPEPFVEARVSDTGIGISRDDLPHLFEKFYGKTDVAKHSSSRTNFKGGGVGLGLSVVKGIVDAHHGQIVIESPGYDEKKLPGTTVRIFLPMLDELPTATGEQRLGLTLRPS
jgi:signal transduction histidine kinase